MKVERLIDEAQERLEGELDVVKMVQSLRNTKLLLQITIFWIIAVTAVKRLR